ncbi:hypothetical protein IMSAGC006_00404 [Muribaculaceae bacterium]|nr:hypothetical protein IMSAGC006_00404 [Muribaculaceae bacterium]
MRVICRQADDFVLLKKIFLICFYESEKLRIFVAGKLERHRKN